MFTYMQKKVSSAANTAANKMSKAVSAAGSAVMYTMGSAKASISSASQPPVFGTSTTSTSPQFTNPTCAEQLQAMGFTREDAVRAIRHVGTADVHAAAEFLCQESEPAVTSRNGAVAPISHSARQNARARSRLEQIRAEFQCQESEPAVTSRSEAIAPIPQSGLTSARQDARTKAVEAAARRHAEAFARNGGTMDDWRRSRLEKIRARQQQTAKDTPARSVRFSLPATTQAEERAFEADEDEDFQRAVMLSMADAAPPAPASQSSSEGSNGAASSSSGESHPVNVATEDLEQMLKNAEEMDELAFQQALMESMEFQQKDWNSAGQGSCSIPLPGTAEWAAASSAPSEEQLIALQEVSELFGSENDGKAGCTVPDQVPMSLSSESVSATDTECKWSLKPSTGTWLIPITYRTCGQASSIVGDIVTPVSVKPMTPLLTNATELQKATDLDKPASPSRTGLVRCGA